VNNSKSDDSAREPLRLEDAARAYGNRPTMQEAIQLSKLFIRDTKHNDLLDSLKWAFDATKKPTPDNSSIDADYTVVSSEPKKPTIITEGDIFVDEVQWNKLMRMLEKYNARQDSPSPPPKRHWSDGLERQRKHKH
jgi:hypothetical protein